MRRRVLCGCWARLSFLGAREKKKALVVVVAKIDEACAKGYSDGAIARQGCSAREDGHP